MALTFDATLKDMGRDSPHGFLAAFDRPPTVPVKLLNVDLSTVTTAADLILGLGEPLQEIIQLDFQSSAAAWKHADLMVYHALLFAHYHVPVHTVLILLRPSRMRCLSRLRLAEARAALWRWGPVASGPASLPSAVPALTTWRTPTAPPAPPPRNHETVAPPLPCRRRHPKRSSTARSPAPPPSDPCTAAQTPWSPTESAGTAAGPTHRGYAPTSPPSACRCRARHWDRPRPRVAPGSAI